MPTCAADCSGRHEVEARFTCPRCYHVAADLIAHEWKHLAGHFFYEVRSPNGTVLPKADQPNECPGCRVALVRR